VFNATLRPPYPREREAVLTVQKAGWAQGQSGQLRKYLPQPGLDPRTVQAVASRYTDCGIPVRPEFHGNPGNAFVADIAFPETRSNFNEQIRRVRWVGAHSHVANCQKWLLLLLIGEQPRHKRRGSRLMYSHLRNCTSSVFGEHFGNFHHILLCTTRGGTS